MIMPRSIGCRIESEPKLVQCCFICGPANRPLPEVPEYRFCEGFTRAFGHLVMIGGLPSMPVTQILIVNEPRSMATLAGPCFRGGAELELSDIATSSLASVEVVAEACRCEGLLTDPDMDEGREETSELNFSHDKTKCLHCSLDLRKVFSLLHFGLLQHVQQANGWHYQDLGCNSNIWF